jgi:hypothetical protein
VPTLALQSEADRRVAAVVSDLIAAMRAGTSRAEASLALVEALSAIRDDLVARHGEAGDEAFSAALDTANAVMVQGRARRVA